MRIVTEKRRGGDTLSVYRAAVHHLSFLQSIQLCLCLEDKRTSAHTRAHTHTDKRALGSGIARDTKASIQTDIFRSNYGVRKSAVSPPPPMRSGEPQPKGI